MRRAWFDCLAKRSLGAVPLDAAFAPAVQHAPLRRALEQAADALVAAGELGSIQREPALTQRFAGSAAVLERQGLTPVATALAALATPNLARPERQLLRAMHLIDRALALTRQLDWLALDT